MPILQMNLSVRRPRVLLCLHTVDLHTSEGCFSLLLQDWNEMAFPLWFWSRRDQPGSKVSWLQSSTWNGLTSSRRKKTRVHEGDVFPSPQISLNLEYAHLPIWKSQWFPPPLTLALDFFFPSSIISKFTAYMRDCTQGTPTQCQGWEASNLTLKMLATRCFTIMHL